jgi:hypothetical protein
MTLDFDFTGSSRARLSPSNLGLVHAMLTSLFSNGTLIAQLQKICHCLGRQMINMQSVGGIGINYYWVDEAGLPLTAVHRSEAVTGTSTVYEGRPLGLVAASGPYWCVRLHKITDSCFLCKQGHVMGFDMV